MRVGWSRHRRHQGHSVVSLDNVERVPHLTADQLDDRHLKAGRPVILTNLFDGSPLRDVADDAKRLKSVLRDVTLAYGPNPVHAAVRGHTAAPNRRASFGTLHDRFARGALPGYICAEHELPHELAALIPPLPHLQLGDPADRPQANIFFSAAGNATHLHFDKDLRHDLVHQVLGRKRFVLVDAAQTPKLAAGPAPDAGYASGLFLDRFSPDDLQAFLGDTGAWDCVLEAGETLFLPATMWHYVTYVDAALSVHLRLARNRPLLRLAEAAAAAGVATVEVQALAATLLDESQVGPERARALDDLEALAHHQGPGDRLSLQRRFRAKCSQAGRRLDAPIGGDVSQADPADSADPSAVAAPGRA